MAIEIVDFTMKNGGSFHCQMLVHQRVKRGFFTKDDDLTGHFCNHPLDSAINPQKRHIQSWSIAILIADGFSFGMGFPHVSRSEYIRFARRPVPRWRHSTRHLRPPLGPPEPREGEGARAARGTLPDVSPCGWSQIENQVEIWLWLTELPSGNLT